jgi:hypothetical protein
MDPFFKWRAFELLVTLAFRPQNIEVRFHSRNLMGEPQDGLWKIGLNQVIEQTSTLDAIPILEPGTLVILKKGHSVADLLAYSSDCELYFIQISLSPYGGHKYKVTDLGRKLIKNGPSIIQHYMSLCLTKKGTKQFPDAKTLKLKLEKALPDGVHYIYVTTSESWMSTKSCQHSHPVTLVAGEDISELLGTNWTIYRDQLIEERVRSRR